MNKKLTSMVLAAAMCVNLVLPAAAAEIPKNEAQYQNGDYIIQGDTYYQAGDKKLENYSTTDNYILYKDLLTSEYSGNGRSMAEDWANLAFWISYHESSTGAPYEPLRQAYESDSWNILDENSEVQIRVDNELFKNKTTGLQFANSVSEAEGLMRDFAKQVYKDNGGSDSDEDCTWPQSGLAEDKTSQPVYYLATRAAKCDGYSGQGGKSLGHGPGMGVIFSDFSLRPILPNQDDSDYQKDRVGETESKPETYSTGTKNDTASVATAEQTLENATTAEVSSDYTKGKEFSWQEGLEIGHEWGVSVGPLEASQHLSVSMSASQAINESWSTGKSKSDSKSTSSTVNVTLPAYTSVLLESSEAQETYKQSWTSPVGLSFKVTIVDLSMAMSHNDKPTTEVVGSFPKGNIVNEPADAQRSLKYRFERRDLLKEPNMNFNAIINKGNGTNPAIPVEQQINNLSTHIPCVSHIEGLTTVIKTTDQRVGGLKALYPMTRIVSGNGMQEYNLDTDEYIYLDSIDVQGKNDKNADFYGFDAEKGSWELVDEQGKVITNSDIATIKTNPVTGQKKLVAGKGEGTLYLKYMIDENYYKSIFKDSPITNETVESYKVPINVTNTELKGGSVDVSGKQDIVAGDPAVTPNLVCKVRNSNGKEVSKPVHWYANDLNTLTVKDDKFQADSTLKAGQYPVVAYVGNDEDKPKVKSAPYNVNVLEKRDMSEIVLPKAELNLRPVKGPNFNVNDIKVEQFDQYHNTAFDKDYNTKYGVSSKLDRNLPVTWVCEDKSVKINKNGDVQLPLKNGTYQFYATATNEKGETVKSNPLTVTMSGFAEGIKMEQPSMSYAGGKNAATITGKNLAEAALLVKLIPDPKDPDAKDISFVTAQGRPDKNGDIHITVNFPKNETDRDQTYEVRARYFGEKVLDSPVAEVTVTHKTYSGGGGGGMILPEAPKATVTSSDKALNLTVNTVNQKVLNNAKQIITKNPNLTLIGSVDESVNVKAMKNNKAVLNFNPPVNVTLPVSDAALKNVKDPHKLTLAQVKTDAKGNTVFDFVGGKYDANAKVFRAKIDCAGDYILVEKADLVKLTMKIGDTRTTLNDAVKGIDAAPVIIDNRTMVPLRYIGESLGFKVDWDESTRGIKISQNDKVLNMTVDVEIPGFGAAPVIRNSRTLVPIRYISESFGARVLYDESVSEIIVVK